MEWLDSTGLTRLWSNIKAWVSDNYLGKSDTAISATKATQDSSGQQINSTYIKGLSVSGKVITYTKGDGTTGTITTQDTNSHYVTGLKVGASASATANAAASNGSVYMNVLDDSVVRDSHNIVGSGATTVASDANGKITISSTNTTYSTGTSSTAGLTKLYTSTGTNTDGTMTQAAIKTAIDSLPDPMVFKGSLGTDGTITELPDASSSNVGYVYKVITAGTYASQAADVGDTFISDGSSWVLIPSGDEPSGTVTSVATGVGLTGGTITSSGTVKAKLKSESSLGSSNSVTTTSGKTYAVGVDSSGYLAVNVPWTDNNTTYSTATTSAAGLMSASDKSKLDAITASADAVSFTQSLTSGTAVGTLTINGTGTTLYAPTNTDTHYTTGLKVGASATATANAAATNGNVYMNALDNTTVRDSHNIVGSGATTVTSDANGKITINSTNTTYSAATTSANGLMSSTDKKNVTYFVEGTQTAATNAWTGTLSGVTPYDGLTIRYYLPYAGTSTGATLALNSGTAYPVYRYGRTTQITTHFAAGSIITMTFRSSYSVAGTSYTNAWIVDAFYDSNSNNNVTNTLATTTKAYVTGTTSATTNTGTQVFDTGVYLDTTAGKLTATTFNGALSGNATTATTLATARTIRTNLASTSSASFNGSANITPGVTGTLPIANGGTGNTTGLAASATKLATARTIALSGAVTGSASFNGTANVTISTTGTVMTGATSSAAGSAGLVPAPAAGKNTSFLRGDGTWAAPETNQATVVTLSADSWTGDAAPYTQSVALSGSTDEVQCEIYLYYPDTITADTAEDYQSAYNCLSMAETGTDTITFTCFLDKPDEDIMVAVRGV